MGKIARSLLTPLKETLATTSKVIVLYGPRQVGKTTLEERQGNLVGFEMKYGRGKARPPKAFLTDYENAEWQVMNEENWLDFVL